MGTFARHEEKFAKRRHKSPCMATGVPIEVGDKYYVYSGNLYEFYYCKMHHIAYEIVAEPPEGPWNHQNYWENLLEWLLNQLSKPEAKACFEAAIKYCKAASALSQVNLNLSEVAK